MEAQRCTHCGQVLPNQTTIRHLEMSDLVRIVTEETGVSTEQMNTKHPKLYVAKAKYIIFYFGYFYSKYTIKTMGNIFKNHHSTVLHGVNTIDQDRRIDFDVANTVNRVLKRLNEEGFFIGRLPYRLPNPNSIEVMDYNTKIA